jgi:hypothetical protein
LDPYAKTSLPTFFLESSSVRHRELADASAAAPLPKSPATGTFQGKKIPGHWLPPSEHLSPWWILKQCNEPRDERRTVAVGGVRPDEHDLAFAAVYLWNASSSVMRMTRQNVLQLEQLTLQPWQATSFSCAKEYCHC